MQLYSSRRKTAHRALQVLFRLFAVFCFCCVAVRPAMLYSLQGARGHTGRRSASTDTRYNRHTGTLYRSAQPPIIIMYIRRQTMPARRGLDASHARRLEVWHRVSGQGGRSGTLHPAGQSSSRGTAGGRNHWRLAAASLFGLSPDS